MILPDPCPYLPDDLQGELQACLQVAAVLIGALMGVGGDELRDHVAVGAVEFYAVKSSGNASCGSVTEIFYGLMDLLDGHFMGDLVIGVGIRDGRGSPGLGFGVLGVGLTAGMVQLCHDHSAMAMDAVGHIPEAGDVCVLPQTWDPLVAFRHAGDGHILRQDQAKATLRLFFHVSGVAFGAGAVFLAVVHEHGRDDHTVFDDLATDGQGTE